MPSPYPGIDPQIERQHKWRGFHNYFLGNAQTHLLAKLPDGYDVETDHRLNLGPDPDGEDEPGGPRRQFGDVGVVRIDRTAGGGGASAAVVEADPRTHAGRQEVAGAPRQAYARVITIPDGELVTVIELLSPSNKGSHYDEFVARRANLLDNGVNLVEFDLLLRGRRLPVVAGIGDAHGFALVTRAETREESDIWAFTLRDRLPRVPVPLKPDDGHVVLDVGAVYAETYDRGGFARRLRYDDAEVASIR